jgi:hypothetical protein
MINTAPINVTDLPDARAVHLVNRVNHDLDFVGLTFPTSYDSKTQFIPDSAVAIERKREAQSLRSKVDRFLPLSSYRSAVLQEGC